MTAVWPLRPDGTENTWQLGAATVRAGFQDGTVRLIQKRDRTTVSYLRQAEKRRIEAGEIDIVGRDERGALVLQHAAGAVRTVNPRTVWAAPGHDAGLYGSQMLRSLIPNVRFPFPKALYAVEDSLRFAVGSNRDAIILDFFAGSGTTAHAVMRLNKQDGGRRQSISVTNNEVSADEQAGLRRQRLRPGDEAWEALGICDHITKPRIRAAVTGQTPDGQAVKGDYKFVDEFPMSDGFEENVEFFDLTYESLWRVARNRDFTAIAPLLWLRAGSRGRRIDTVPAQGWDVADTYGVLVNLDAAKDFTRAVSDAGNVDLVFLVTDDDRRFQMVAKALPETVDVVRLYESYLRNFEINTGRR